MDAIGAEIEGIICGMANCVLSKFIKPDIKLSEVKQLTEDDILRLKIQYGIKGMILDVDKTIRKNKEKIPKCNQQWIDLVSRYLRIVVVSNAKDENLKQFFEDRDIEYITLAFKPLSIGFKKACEELGLLPNEILVVGDSVLSDIYGGNRMKMRTAQVGNVFDDSDLKNSNRKKSNHSKRPNTAR